LKHFLLAILASILFFINQPLGDISGQCSVPVSKESERHSELVQKIITLTGGEVSKLKAAEISRSILRHTTPLVFPSPEYVLAVIKTESNFVDSAVHRVGPSVGLMQINLQAHKLENPTSIEENISKGIQLLKEYYRLAGSEEKALMYYNMGPRKAEKACLKRCRTAYVDKVTSNLRKVQLTNVQGNLLPDHAAFRLPAASLRTS